MRIRHLTRKQRIFLESQKERNTLFHTRSEQTISRMLKDKYYTAHDQQFINANIEYYITSERKKK
jgi:hypothetical protein